jgi:D-inositol-3-phosphate glycosyltransferase
VADAGLRVSDAEAARATLELAAEWHRRVAAESGPAIVEAARVLREALERGGRVLVFGNGGSAGDAQHFAAELVGQYGRGPARRALPVIALPADTAVVTSLANDLGYEQVFARQVQAFGQRGDVAVGITTSGMSANVTAALAMARSRGLATIALTGSDGGESGRLADVHVNVPAAEAARAQEVHRTILHIWCGLIEKDM